jgi:hypothetical protein
MSAEAKQQNKPWSVEDSKDEPGKDREEDRQYSVKR